MAGYQVIQLTRRTYRTNSLLRSSQKGVQITCLTQDRVSTLPWKWVKWLNSGETSTLTRHLDRTASRHYLWRKRHQPVTLAPALSLQIALSGDWNEAFISPIFKKGDRSKPANYIPVSLTCVCCKLIEHIITNLVMKHLRHHNILTYEITRIS